MRDFIGDDARFVVGGDDQRSRSARASGSRFARRPWRFRLRLTHNGGQAGIAGIGI
ncbi:MAG: hypothetical protein MZV64_01720 [Ignavibacteriales bacterium]|nr:hypothetical protein [Ignavibacteriales bacterium]